MRIGFISNSDPTNIKSWSGTNFYLFKNLNKISEVEWINLSDGIVMKVFQYFLYNFYLKVLRRRSSPEHTLFYTFFKSFRLNNILKSKKNYFDVLFVPVGCQLISFIKTNIPIIYLSDATFASVVGYYPEYSDLPRWNIKQGHKIENRALKKASKVIFSSHWAKESAQKDYEINAQKMVMIPFGANIDYVTYKQNNVSKNKDFKCLRLLFVGVNFERKGGSIAIDVAREIVKRGFDCKLYLVGKIPDNIKEDETIRILGFLNKQIKADKKKLKEVQMKADFLLLPTRADCSPIAFCEAACLGLPVITYDTGGIGDYVENGINGYRLSLNSDINDFADKILELYNQKTYEKLRKSSREKYEKELNWDQWLDTFEKKIINI